MGGETKMKRLLGIVTILCMVFSLSTSVFADRILLIPDVPKTPYRGGIGAYEGVVAHSTTTPKHQPLIFKNMRHVPGEMHSFITQWTGMKRFKLRIQNMLRMVQDQRPINDLFMWNCVRQPIMPSLNEVMKSM